MEFREIREEDRVWVEPLLRASGYQGCDYTFGNLFIWKDLYRQQVAEVGGMLCVRSYRPGTDEVLYLYPAGDGDLEKAIAFLREDARRLGVQLLLRGFAEKEARTLRDLYPGTFQIESVRSEWDYLYRVEDLSELAGKKYHGKRNHIAHFENCGDWRFEPLNSENMQSCIDMCEIWYQEHMTQGNLSALTDRGVVYNALCLFEKLGFTGGVLWQFDHVVGFTLGEPLNQDTYVVHVEKAFAEVDGAYPMINREYVRHYMKGYTYVNREEDDGLEGLRRAKESYHPILLEKYTAREV